MAARIVLYEPLLKEIRHNPMLWLLTFVPVVFAIAELKPRSADHVLCPVRAGHGPAAPREDCRGPCVCAPKAGTSRQSKYCVRSGDPATWPRAGCAHRAAQSGKVRKPPRPCKNLADCGPDAILDALYCGFGNDNLPNDPPACLIFRYLARRSVFTRPRWVADTQTAAIGARLPSRAAGGSSISEHQPYSPEVGLYGWCSRW
jgi:hypothetical protein